MTDVQEFHQSGRLSKPVKIAIAALVALISLAAIIAIVVGVTVSATSVYPTSSSGELFLLQSNTQSRAKRSGEPRVVARSYDGNAWELVSDLDYPPDTSALSPTKAKYTVVNVPVGSELKNPTLEGRTFRLLSQATFGATRAQLDNVTNRFGSNPAGWIAEQMALPATSLRQYLRLRVNQPQEGATSVGPVREACELGSRWHRYLFNTFDIGSVLTVTLGSSRYELAIEGLPRGELTTFRGEAFPPTINSYPVNFSICNVDEGVGRLVYFAANSVDCQIANRTLNMSNPTIEFATLDPLTTQVFSAADAQLFTLAGYRIGNVILTSLSVACQDVGVAGNIYMLHDGSYYRFSPRVKLFENTLENPVNISAAAANVCPSVVKNFINENTCQRRPSCAPLSFSNALVTLDAATLRAWYLDSALFVYYLTDLRLEGVVAVSPCITRTSRWQRVAGTCSAPTALDALTNNTLFSALSASADANVYVRDLPLSSLTGNCTYLLPGVQIQVGGECFVQVHPNLYDVVDASYWGAIGHPGNEDAINNDRPNPIQKWAQQGFTYLPFPGGHPITRFEDNSKFFTRVGRYGDSLSFRALPVSLQTPEMAARVGASSSGRDTPAVAFQACGSPLETGNDPKLGHRYQVSDETPEAFRQIQLDWRYNIDTGKSMLWTNVVLGADDQLRQRVAWALAQIFTVAETGFGREDEIEPWAAYYDIFVRHAFGNYRDIMREVSYSPMMGEYLSFVRNQAFAVSRAFPDENYARELMQLFSIGLVQLNTDGSRVQDSSGSEISSYTNEDIVDFARIWTGFDYQQPRANIQARSGPFSSNILDPMQIKPLWRDKFPKGNLYGGYIGDQYPLCVDRAPNHWVRTGATWVLTGDTSVEGPDMDAELDPSSPAGIALRGRFTPNPSSSALYQLLCAPVGGRCTYPAKVVLTADLACDGDECGAGRVISAKIVDPGNPLLNSTKYYTYVSAPCVGLTFWPGSGKLVNSGTTRQCANPKEAVAMPVCCEALRRNRVISNYTAECLFANEATTYDTARARCEAMGYAVCQNYTGSASWQRTCARSTFQWGDNDCKVTIQVFSSGRISLVDPIINSSSFIYLMGNTDNVFRVFWRDDSFPLASAGCGSGCTTVSTSAGDSCLCDVSVTEGAVYTETDKPSRDAIVARLFVGATDPRLSPTSYTSSTYDDVTVWNPTGQTVWSDKTIFEVARTFSSQPRFLRNIESTVSVGSSFSFRNPPHFLPLLGAQVFTFVTWTSDEIYDPEAVQEIEALLDHLFEHPNTAPFVAKRLIQRLTSSNPSYRYIKAVADAFISGTYAPSGITFSGKYGDLGATVAAILLDREARNTILEADPSAGLVREPLVRLMQIFRAFEFKTTDTREVHLPGLDGNIGQEAFAQPTVFGFYSPLHRPVGPLDDSGLASPELELATMPFQINTLNGISSLVNRGLTACNSGFGWTYHEAAPSGRFTGNSFCRNLSSPADGYFTFAPSATDSSVVDELDRLLTGGRLHNSTREYIRELFEATSSNKTFLDAYKLAQKLILTSVEFQTTNAHVPQPRPLTTKPEVPSQGRPYKAIVVVFEQGGADSFNLLVPHSNCKGGMDYYAEYAAVRQGAALPKSMLNTIAVPPGQQPCDTFGVHAAMPNLKALYDAGDALFLASIGALIEPTTKDDYLKKSGRTVRLPPSLFAHNTMTNSMQNLHPLLASATGVLGRAVESLKTQAQNPYRSEMYSLAGFVKMLEGSAPPDAIDSRNGVKRFEEFAQLGSVFLNLTKNASSSHFGSTYSNFFQNSLNRSEFLSSILSNASVTTNFSTQSSLSLQLLQVAKLIKSRDKLETERAVFFVQSGGYDTHATFDLSPLFGSVDAALASFEKEMKLQGVWDSVAILSVSEFGRTLTPNGGGTDHAWSGHHFLAGGAVKGGQVLGQYPESLQLSNELNLGRGRFLPTNSWEAVWKGLIQWFGVTDAAALDAILPNLKNFPDSQVWSETDLFN